MIIRNGKNAISKSGVGRARMTVAHRQGPKSSGLSRKAIWNVVSTWQIWLFTEVYSCYIFAQSEFLGAGSKVGSLPR